MTFVVTIERQSESVEVTGGRGRYRVIIGDRAWDVDARLSRQGICSLLVDGVSYVVEVADHQGTCAVEVGGESYTIAVEEATRHVIRTRGGAIKDGGGQTVKAPMPGKITHVAVRVGDRVALADTVVIIEAMKMENELKAMVPGTVREIRAEAGQAVNAGDILVVIE
ncbi:MAG: biotin/lipoyl-containing protein [Candidatus Rokuibacteriota bacterium]